MGLDHDWVGVLHLFNDHFRLAFLPPRTEHRVAGVEYPHRDKAVQPLQCVPLHIAVVQSEGELVNVPHGVAAT